MRWSENQTYHFVKQYMRHENLWNSKHEHYKVSNIRMKSYKEIISQFCDVTGIDLNIAELKIKIKSLRSTYVQEVAKIKRRSGPDHTYRSNLRWFPIWHKCFVKTNSTEDHSLVYNYQEENMNNLSETWVSQMDNTSDSSPVDPFVEDEDYNIVFKKEPTDSFMKQECTNRSKIRKKKFKRRSHSTECSDESFRSSKDSSVSREEDEFDIYAMTSKKETKPKLKRKFISLQQKIDILDQLNNGKKSTVIAKDLELNESTIRTIKQNESKIRSAVTSRSLQALSNSSRVKDSLIPKTEKCLMIWIEDCKRNNIPTNSCLIKAKAQKIFTHLKETEMVSSDKPKTKFVSSNGWFERFRKRFALDNTQIQGERATADYESVRKFKDELSKIIGEGGYTSDQVYNADETGLYWKKMPKRTYLSKSERSAAGFKASKERITLLVCSNASGDHITKPMLINPTLNPRAMKGIDKTTLPVYWRVNKKARITAAIFHDWFYNCFVPEVENYSKTKNINFKALLLIDNAPVHPVDLVHPNVKVLFLPPNTTSILQPLDRGITKALKSHYIRRTFEHILETFECNPDMKLPEMWRDFSILKCVELIFLSVQELKSSTLNACWKAIWPEIVLQENSSGSTSIDIEAIVNIARSVGGEGFDDINEGDIYALINDADDLDEEELVQLADTSDVNIINTAEESSMRIIEEVDENLCTENLNKIVKMAKQLEILVTNFDSKAERATEFKMNLQQCLAPYVKMQKKIKIENEKSLNIEVLIKKEEQEDMLLSKENNKNSNDEIFKHSIKKRFRWKAVLDSSDSE